MQIVGEGFDWLQVVYDFSWEIPHATFHATERQIGQTSISCKLVYCMIVIQDQETLKSQPKIFRI